VTPNAGGLGAIVGCPGVTGFVNAASRAALAGSLVADCVVAVRGENFGPHADQFDPPVNEAFGIFARFSSGDRFPIYALASDEIVCVVPGTLSAPEAFIMELNVPPPGGLHCPAIVLKGIMTPAAPGLFTQNGSGQGAGLFYTFPDGIQQPIPSEGSGGGGPMLIQAYGTGFRHAAAVSASIGAIDVAVISWEADTTRPGYDRLIFELPAGLAPGTHLFKVTADAGISNEVEMELV